MSIQMPSIDSNSFLCPHCGALAHQDRGVLHSRLKKSFQDHEKGIVLAKYQASQCYACGHVCLWVDDQMVYPGTLNVAPPNVDMPEDIKRDYLEAKEIAGRSPRGAAAILRLAVEKLVASLGAKNNNLNAAVQELVDRGLDVRIQKALDAVRVIGNQQVHPGTLDISDKPETVGALFEAINLVVDEMISKDRKVNALYELLPDTKRQQIETRAKGARTKPTKAN